jgi:hypothetical protein
MVFVESGRTSDADSTVQPDALEEYRRDERDTVDVLLTPASWGCEIADTRPESQRKCPSATSGFVRFK